MGPEATQALRQQRPVLLTHGLPSEPDPHKGRANLNPPSHMRLFKIHYYPYVITAGIDRRNRSSSLCLLHRKYWGWDVFRLRCYGLRGTQGSKHGPSVATGLGCICLCVCVHPHTSGENQAVGPRVYC